MNPFSQLWKVTIVRGCRQSTHLQEIYRRVAVVLLVGHRFEHNSISNPLGVRTSDSQRFTYQNLWHPFHSWDHIHTLRPNLRLPRHYNLRLSASSQKTRV